MDSDSVGGFCDATWLRYFSYDVTYQQLWRHMNTIIQLWCHLSTIVTSSDYDISVITSHRSSFYQQLWHLVTYMPHMLYDIKQEIRNKWEHMTSNSGVRLTCDVTIRRQLNKRRHTMAPERQLNTWRQTKTPTEHMTSQTRLNKTIFHV